VRLTILGTGTARPWPDTAASGVLVRTATTAVLFDIGSGIAARLQAELGADHLDGLVVGHLHADHWIDIAPLRYRFPWGDANPRPLPVRLPPGGRERLEALSGVISERPGFFDVAFEVSEYAADEALRFGDLTVTPRPRGHYVPAFTMDIVGPAGERLVYAGDMGPSEELVELARGADLLVLEATLEDARFDDPRRGHLTPEEAIDHALRSGVRRAVLVHYPSDRRSAIEALCAATDGRVIVGRSGMTVAVGEPT
jgi:ribonuclease BN (tRNA processing enzyme)